ncbi:response regulator [Magnetospirillum sp. SS-4]|uniref:response regulator n=1 Tax=Magnetospirillum sp. SS-4 TaxID=2681465 RepID=UPI0013865A76|nr:response regulator [Magnetospirillum sp. SS-4]CAA7620366.1 hypothetical protein MTBSS4_280036 [Magnetospirillum sp. SS-4]
MTKKLLGTRCWAAFLLAGGRLKMAREAEVLFVEDSECYAHLFEIIVGQIEYKCRLDKAVNGAEAIRKLKERFESEDTFYDVVITDLHMNFINGIELTKYIRSLYANMNIPIVVMSSQDASEVGMLAHDAGANRFIQKPAHIDELFQAITNVISDFIVKIGHDIERRKVDN